MEAEVEVKVERKSDFLDLNLSLSLNLAIPLPLADVCSILLERRSLTPIGLFEEERALRESLIASVGDLLAMRL